MKCSYARGRLMDYQDGLVDREQALRIERHLAECPACRAELGGLRMAVDRLADLPEAPATDALTLSVMARITAIRAEERSASNWAAIGAAVGIGGLAAVAALVFVALTVPLAAYAPALLGIKPLAGEALALGGFAANLLPSLLGTFVRTISGPAMWAIGVDLGLLTVLIVVFRAFSRRRVMLPGNALLPV
ncbi:MAG TPA: hypothetical protein DGT21_02250 [Armatimonadetes bacterium]|jgi:anti-sigma factor RsiW|nr:hypothetical protein [Armatimonadota bacterium]